MVILSKIISNSVLKQYWEYRISSAKAINWFDKSEHFIITVRTLQGLWYFTTTLCMYLQRLSTFKLLKNMSFFYILYKLIKKILKILYWGRNLQGRTGKGPKPLGAEPEKGRNLWHSSRTGWDFYRLEKGSDRGIYPDRGTIPWSGYNNLHFFFTKSWKFSDNKKLIASRFSTSKV